MGNLICRTRFIDDAYRTAVADGVEQIALLGAGLDSRALRFPAPPSVRVFEVDHPATQAWKRRRLEMLDVDTTRRPTLVAVDFERKKLSAALRSAGYQANLRTLFVWEGVTQYITEASVDATFGFVSRSAHARSRIVFTYIDRGVIEGRRLSEDTERLLAELERNGEPWRFGIEPENLASFLAARGLSLIEDVGAEEYRVSYLRPAGREMALFDGERVAIAEVAAGSATNEQRKEPCP
jgi:methyltransferase (TIGR00027 family)